MVNNIHRYEDQVDLQGLQEMAYTLSQDNLIPNLQSAVVIYEYSNYICLKISMEITFINSAV